jgi:hypothetical protein
MTRYELILFSEQLSLLTPKVFSRTSLQPKPLPFQQMSVLALKPFIQKKSYWVLKQSKNLYYLSVFTQPLYNFSKSRSDKTESDFLPIK